MKPAGEVVAALAEVVRSGDSFRRRAAVDALSEFGPAAEAAIPALLRALRGSRRQEASILL